MRITLPDSEGGAWVEMDSGVPLELFDAAIQSPSEEAFRQFFVAAVSGWSVDAPLPAEDPGVLRRKIPWYWPELLLLSYLFCHRLRPEEEDWIFQDVAIPGSARGVVSVLQKIRLCERLNVPFAESYSKLKAGEIIKARHALSVEAGSRQSLKGG